MATSAGGVGIDHVTVVPENFDRDAAAGPTLASEPTDDRDDGR